MRQRPWLWLLLALAAGCDGFTDPAGVVREPLEGTLELELRDTVALTIEVADDGVTTAVTLIPSAGFGVLQPDTPLSAPGRIETFAETGTTLYVAKLSAAPVSSGPCGTEPISIALSLHRQGDNDVVTGGLAAYCGANQWYGVPAAMLRIAGTLPAGN
ncbi:MAG: hypothetical protein JRI68_03195 [Deltaproteobacteria bacterium]|nr:hypothetical protein [Deltaproteobacteria bacterium]